jgi:tetratricopeptide (TPR) repeat protein
MLFLSAIIGCSGGGHAGGISLEQQHQRALQMGDARSRAIRLIQIAYQRDELGDMPGAHESLSSAVEAARAIDHADEKAETLASAAYAAGVIRWITEANSLAKETRAAIEQAESKQVAAAAAAKLAVVYGKHLDNATAADAQMQQAEAIADQIESPEERAAALLAIAGCYHELGKTDEARQSADEATELGRGISDARRRAETLAAAGLRYQKIGQSEASLAAFDEAEAAADAVADSKVRRAYALLAVADKLQAAGQAARAAQVLEKVEDLAFALTDQGEKEPLLAQLNRQRSKLP